MASAYPGRYTDTSRTHTESDLRRFLLWCSTTHLTPLTAHRAQIEWYVRWMQEPLVWYPHRMRNRGGRYWSC